MHDFWLCFIPLFVAVDAIGVLPIFMSLTEGVEQQKLRSILIQSLLTAIVAGVIFLLVGNWVLKVLGITIADFMVAGGDASTRAVWERFPLGYP
jgi:multiple antibiotic resistance protein